MKEDNEACGEAAAVAAAASVCDIEPREGQALSAAFDFLATYLSIYQFLYLLPPETKYLPQWMFDEGAGLVGRDCCWCARLSASSSDAR